MHHAGQAQPLDSRHGAIHLGRVDQLGRQLRVEAHPFDVAPPHVTDLGARLILGHPLYDFGRFHQRVVGAVRP